MRVWRLTLERHVVPDGEGARRFGGRWNKPGTPVVYTSGTLSLAVLEYLVHVDSDLLPDSLVKIEATIPDTLAIETFLPSDLPADWKDAIVPVTLQERGTTWATGGKSAILKVPSAIIDGEWNYVVNPLHPDFSKITWSSSTPFSFDPRLLS